jgi:hypothetical protein
MCIGRFKTNALGDEETIEEVRDSSPSLFIEARRKSLISSAPSLTTAHGSPRLKRVATISLPQVFPTHRGIEEPRVTLELMCGPSGTMCTEMLLITPGLTGRVVGPA